MNDVTGSGVDTCTGENGYLYEMIKKNAVRLVNCCSYYVMGIAK